MVNSKYLQYKAQMFNDFAVFDSIDENWFGSTDISLNFALEPTLFPTISTSRVSTNFDKLNLNTANTNSTLTFSCPGNSGPITVCSRRVSHCPTLVIFVPTSKMKGPELAVFSFQTEIAAICPACYIFCHFCVNSSMSINFFIVTSLNTKWWSLII